MVIFTLHPPAMRHELTGIKERHLNTHQIMGGIKACLGPGDRQGLVVEGLHQQVDILGTVGTLHKSRAATRQSGLNRL